MYSLSEFHSIRLFISLLHLKCIIIYAVRKTALNTSEESEDCAFYRLMLFVATILLFISALTNGIYH